MTDASPALAPAVTEQAPSEATHVRGSALLLGGRMLAMAAGFGTQVLIVRYLSKSDFGAFAYGLSLAVLLQSVLPLGLDRTDTRFLALYDERRDFARLLGVIVTETTTILSLGVLAMASVFMLRASLGQGHVGNDALRTVVLILACLAPIAALDDMVLNVFAVFARPRAVFFRRYLLEPGLRLLVVTVVTTGKLTVTALAIGYLAAAVIGGTIYALLLLQLLRHVRVAHREPARRIRAPVRELFGFALPVASSNLVTAAAVALPAMVLAHVAKLSEVAEVQSVQPVAALNLLVSTSFTTLFTPTATRLFARGDQSGFRALYWGSSGWITVLTFPVFALTTVFARPVTETLFGERYEHAAPYLAVMSAGYFVQAATGFNGLSLQVAGRVKYILAANLGALAFAVVANLALVPLLHAPGAVAAMVLTMLVHNLLKQRGLDWIGVGRWNSQKVPIYVWTLGIVAPLFAMDRLVSLPLFVAIPVTAVAFLVLLHATAESLGLDEVFPEVARLPLIHRLLHRKRRLAATAVNQAVPLADVTPRSTGLDAGQLLDWRFLLPSALANTVAVGRRIDPQVTAALRASGHHVVAAEEESSAAVMVLRDPSDEELTLARATLDRGGLLQVHVGATTRLPVPVPVMRRWQARLARSGFLPSRMYWAVPCLDRPRMLVPLDDHSAVRLALNRQGARVGWTPRSILVELLLRLRLVGLLAREGVLVAQVSEAQR